MSDLRNCGRPLRGSYASNVMIQLSFRQPSGRSWLSETQMCSALSREQGTNGHVFNQRSMRIPARMLFNLFDFPMVNYNLKDKCGMIGDTENVCSKQQVSDEQDTHTRIVLPFK